MTDPTGGTIAQITESMLRSLHAAQQSGGAAAVAQRVNALAAQLGTSTAAIVRGVAVSTASTSASVASWARFVVPYLEAATATGTLVLSETAAGAAAVGTVAASSAAGVAAWWAGLAIGAKIAVLVAAGVLVAGAATVIGSQFGDSPSAEIGDIQGSPFLAPPPTDAAPTARYVGVGAAANGLVTIVSVRTTVSVGNGIEWCSFRHGGNTCGTMAQLQVLTQEYDNPQMATSELCASLAGPPYPAVLADGYQGDLGGRVVTIDDFGSLDFAACEAAAGSG